MASEFHKKLGSSTWKTNLCAELADEFTGFAGKPDQFRNKFKKLKMKKWGKSSAGCAETSPPFNILNSVMGHGPANQDNATLNSATASTLDHWNTGHG